MRSMLLAVFMMSVGAVYAQTLIPFEFVSEEENRFIKENDTFRFYVASGDTTDVVCISEESLQYRLLNKDQRVIAEGSYLVEADKYLQDGKWTDRYDNGRIKHTGYYQRGIPIGTWQEFFSNGKPRIICNYGIFMYNNDILSCLSGTYQEFYKNGNIKATGFYCAEIKTVRDTVKVADPVSGADVDKVITHKELVTGKTGQWEYFNENGEPEKKEEQ